MGTYNLPDKGKGPKQWHMPTDCLAKQEIATHCEMLLDNFDETHPVSSWEILKVKVQSGIQSLTKFCVKQVEAEMKSLKSSL